MDAFQASIETNRNPKLKNKPIVVGENIVTTASYEARKFGIHSAMKVSDAKLLCPKLIVIPVDKTEYIRISNHKPPLQVVVCSMPKRQCYKLEAKALQLVCLSRIAPFSY